jgi:hypothetical protein
MAAGDFSESHLPDIVARIGELYADPRSNKELDKPIETARGVLESQRVTWNPTLFDGTTCVGVKAAWLKDCEDDIISCADGEFEPPGCEIGGNQLQSDSILYKPNDCLIGERFVPDAECKDIFVLQDKVAYAMASLEMKILEKLNAKVIAFLDANSDMNTLVGGPGNPDPISPITYFPNTAWTPEIIADLAYIATQFNIMNPIAVTGYNLWNSNFNASFNALNDNQRDQIAKLGFMPIFFDPQNIDSVMGQRTTFVFDPGNLGFFTTNQFQNLAALNMMDRYNTMVMRYDSQKLFYNNGTQRLPVSFDVQMQRKCNTVYDLNQQRWGWSIRMKLTFGLYTGPADCNGVNGIFQFAAGDGGENVA